MEAGSPTPHFYCSPTTRTAGLTCYKLSINYDLNLDFQIILLKAPSNQTCKELLVFKGTYYNFLYFLMCCYSSWCSCYVRAKTSGLKQVNAPFLAVFFKDFKISKCTEAPPTFCLQRTANQKKACIKGGMQQLDAFGGRTKPQPNLTKQ